MSAEPRTTSSLLRRMNTREVLAALQRQGPLSRAEIARHTGISNPTITRTVADLLAARLLEEGELQQAPLGRPAKVLRLATETVSVLGVVVGVKTCELVSAGLDGLLHDDRVLSFPTPPRYGDLVRRIAEHAERCARESKTAVLGLGISIPGLLSRKDQRTLVSPNLHQTDGQQLGVDVAERLGLETAILQETHALCLAEQTYGAARGVEDFAMLDITGGLGLGVVQGGRFLQGHRGLAGELGHLTVDLAGRRCGCGNLGCLETVATDTALAQLVGERLRRELSTDEVIAQIKSGQIAADAEMALVLDYLAVGLAAVINLFNPQKLFIYGRLFDAGPRVYPKLLEATARRTLAPSLADCEIIRARGNKRLGAVAGIIERLMTGT
ncbi:MAG: ROK family transcriptional regulator [Pirellulaceae bacterium]|nr:ROK family transcriptional regulator [Pirellulaceae bacterium]